jgi:hypothetical protein
MVTRRASQHHQHVSEPMPSRFVITDHALSRFGERTALPDEGLRQSLQAELERGVPFGGQLGEDELYLLPSGDVAAVVWERGDGIVKTILTREHAIANMQSRGATLRSSPELHVVIRETELRALAELHFNTGVSRKRRNALLREHGYDPAGKAGKIYRAAYRAALEAKWAANREAYLQRKSSAS